MRNVSIEVSDYEYIVFNEAVEGAKQYYTEVFNDSNYSYLLIMDEDQVRELKDLIECYLLDEDTIVGCSTYDIVKDILNYAHKLRLSGVDKESILKRIINTSVRRKF